MKKYQRIKVKLEAKLSRDVQRVLTLETHLMNHPADYQARIRAMTLNSSNLALQKELRQLDYLAEVEKYR